MYAASWGATWYFSLDSLKSKEELFKDIILSTAKVICTKCAGHGGIYVSELFDKYLLRNAEQAVRVWRLSPSFSVPPGGGGRFPIGERGLGALDVVREDVSCHSLHWRGVRTR